MIESDVHVSRDGHAVLAHDPDGSRLAGDPRPLADCTLAEIERWDLARAHCGGASSGTPARIPTLDAALTRLPNACWNLDIKTHDARALPAVLDVIARHGVHARVLLTSFSSVVTHELRARGYKGPIGLAQTEAIAAVFTPNALLRAWTPAFICAGARLQIPTRSAGIPLARRALTDKLRALGVPVDYWVINDAQEAERLLMLGAQGIVTDDVQAMATLFERSSLTAGWRTRRSSRLEKAPKQLARE